MGATAEDSRNGNMLDLSCCSCDKIKTLFISQFEGKYSHMLKIISDTYEVTYCILARFGM